MFGSTISSNTFQLSGNNSEGLGLVIAFKNIIAKNTFIGDKEEYIYGINIGTSRNNIISDNVLDGIALFSVLSGGNTISANTIENNGEDGIYMFRGYVPAGRSA